MGVSSCQASDTEVAPAGTGRPRYCALREPARDTRVALRARRLGLPPLRALRLGSRLQPAQPATRVTGFAAQQAIDRVAHREEGKAPTREAMSHQEQLASRDEVSERAAITPQGLVSAIRDNRADLAPMPAGHVGRFPFWLRHEVDAWVAEHGELIARRRDGGHAGRSGRGPRS